jgi:hypothetical protein
MRTSLLPTPCLPAPPPPPTTSWLASCGSKSQAHRGQERVIFAVGRVFLAMVATRRAQGVGGGSGGECRRKEQKKRMLGGGYGEGSRNYRGYNSVDVEPGTDLEERFTP